MQPERTTTEAAVRCAREHLQQLADLRRNIQFALVKAEADHDAACRAKSGQQDPVERLRKSKPSALTLPAEYNTIADEEAAFVQRERHLSNAEKQKLVECNGRREGACVGPGPSILTEANTVVRRHPYMLCSFVWNIIGTPDLSLVDWRIALTMNLTGTGGSTERAA